MTQRGSRAHPVFLDLRRIRQPVTAVVSLGHRVSGVILVLLVPGLAWLLQQSLRGPDSFADITALLSRPAARVTLVLLVWALAHHVLAGIRHLLFDIHVATGPPHRPDHLRAVQPRVTAWMVLAGELIVVLLTMAVLA